MNMVLIPSQRWLESCRRQLLQSDKKFSTYWSLIANLVHNSLKKNTTGVGGSWLHVNVTFVQRHSEIKLLQRHMWEKALPVW